MQKMMQSQQVIEELYTSFAKSAANIISYYNGNQRKEKLAELRDIVLNNCVQDQKLQSALKIKDRLLSLYYDVYNKQPVNVGAVASEYKKAISEINTDVSKDSKLLEFDGYLKALLDKAGDEENDGDEEMQLKGGLINVIDPISKKRIVDPVKNILCGHTYDRKTITAILNINNKTRCPIAGCKSKEFVTLEHLRTDIITKAYLVKNPQ